MDIYLVNTNKKKKISPDVHPVLHTQGCKMWTLMSQFRSQRKTFIFSNRIIDYLHGYNSASMIINHFIIQLMHNVKYVELIKTY